MSEERLTRAIGAVAAWLELRGETDACVDLFAADTLAEVEAFAAARGIAVDRPGVPEIEYERWSPALDAMEQTLRGIPAYAGRDVLRGRFVSVGFTENLLANVRRARDAFAFPTRISGFSARFTLVELDAAHMRLRAEWDDLNAGGLEISSLSRDQRANRVVVTSGAQDRGRVRRELAERYGDIVVLDPVPHGPWELR